MKNFIGLLIVLVFSSICLAQNSTVSKPEAEAVSVSFNQKRLQSLGELKPVYSNVPYHADPSLRLPNTTPPPDSVQYSKQLETIVPGKTKEIVQNRFEVNFRNNTQKKITSIKYSVSIVRNSNGAEVMLYSFDNNSEIKARQTKKLTNVVTEDFNLPYKQPQYSFKTKIESVKFSDGSVWTP